MLDLRESLAVEVTAPPTLAIRGDSAAKSLRMTALSVSAAIRGLAAETTLVMTFRNEHDRVLEGELVFPLPEGGVVCGYGLDVDGEVVDGVVVPRERARVVFEEEVRKDLKKDPGLVETVRGNLFRTRVYPLPPRGERTVKVVFTSDLLARDGAALYYLPLNLPEALDRFALRVAVAATDVAPEAAVDGAPAPDFRRRGDEYVAETEAKAVRPGKVLVGLPELTTGTARVERGPDGAFYFAIEDPVPPAPPPLSAPPVGRLGLLWDASLSRAKTDKTREFAVLARVLSRLGFVYVDLLVFRDRPEEIRSFRIEDGDATALLAHLSDLPYDGGTDLRALAAAPPDADAHLLVSDGLSTMGPGEVPALPRPVFAVSAAAEVNGPLLRDLARRSGGAWLPLASMSDEEAAAAVARPVFRFLGVKTAEGEVADVLPPPGATPGAWFRVTGRLLSPEARVVLRYGYGDSSVVGSYSLRRAAASEGTVVPRLWAAAKIATLSAAPERHEAALLDLGRRFSLVTPGASLLLLETLEQHLEHGIEPHPSRRALREEYLARVRSAERDEAARRAEKMLRVGALWRQRVAWWEATHEPKPLEEKREAPLPPDGMPHPRLARAATAPSAAPATEFMAAMSAAPPMAAGDAAPPSAPADAPEAEAKSSPAVSIALRPWAPGAPYLRSLEAAGPQGAYAAYLAERAEHGASPAFYFDCAHHLLRAGRRAEALRVLSAVTDFRLDDPQLLRIAAYFLFEAGEIGAAVEHFAEVLRLRPEEPQSRRDLALALARQGDLDRAASLLAEVVTGNWDDRFDEIEQTALMELNRLLARARREGRPVPAPDLPADLLRPLDCDVRIVLAWDTDLTDVDLHVLEPNGEDCFYGHRQTTGGGALSRDFRLGYGPEEYFLRRAVPGTYRVRAKYFSSRRQDLSGATTLLLTLFTDYGRPNEVERFLTLRLSEPKDIVDVGEVTRKP